MSIRKWSATTKRMRSSAAAIGVAGAVALGSLAVGGVFAQPSDQQVIGTGTIVTAGQVGANCRAEPSIDAQFLTLVPDGQTVAVTGAAENDFLPVVCNDQNGWIYAPLVTNIIPATPVATPGTPAATEAPATPAAVVPAWVDSYAVDADTVVEGDSATVGVKVGDTLEINQPAFETRPYVILQTTNATEKDTTLVLFTAP
ncbi:MAG TPA: SH3 domain-containing protein, partial [Thermomicrobiales bacterium]|nr:SH3 domain-containing protein [Thermomicrobiales bacterium]